MKYRVSILSAIAAISGLGLGEIAWAISNYSPNFAWPQWSHGRFYLAGMALGLVWAWAQSLFWRLTFFWDYLWGLRIGAASLLPCLLGVLWHLVIRIKLPPPHDFPLRNLEILAAAQIILCLAGTAKLGILGLWQSRSLITWSPRSLAIRLGALSFVVYLLSGFWTGSWQMTGDAPHYVLLTHSLVYDHDVDLANNYKNGDWRNFYDYGDLVAQLPSQSDGRQISEHKVGLPLLLAPGYYFLGITGIRWTLSILAAVGSGLFFLLCLALKFDRRMALFGWALFSFTAAWWTHSQIVLTEMPGGLMILLVLAAWYEVIPRPWVVIACSFMLWLNIRFFPVAAVMILMECFERRKEGNLKLLFVLACFGLSLALTLFYNYAEYGSISPAQTYVQRQLPWNELIKISNVIRYSSGLMIDQEYGWLPYIPVFALSLFGFWSLAAKRNLLFWRLLIPSLIYIGPIACFPWWASAMAPNRYVLPLTAIFALSTLEAFRTWGYRPSFMILASLSWGWGICLNILPWLCWGKLDGQNLFLKIVGQKLHINLTTWFPSFWTDKPDSYFWILGLAILALLSAWHLGSPKHSRRAPESSPL